MTPHTSGPDSTPDRLSPADPVPTPGVTPPLSASPAVPPLPQGPASGPVEAGPVGRVPRSERPLTRVRSTVVQWIGVAFGVLILLGATGRLTAAPVQALATALLAFAVILPFAWTIRCRHRDRRAFLAWTQEIETTRRIAPYLTDADRSLLQGFDDIPAPRPVPRRWPAVAAVTLGLVIVAMLLAPPEPRPDASGTAPAPASHPNGGTVPAGR
ncbi:hypothetical protein CBOVI_07075 [Corynebacterium bovis DSM 20582 = CIP 54.80]|nr:hypothetical protein CXF29_04865 [Corynebacterium bovis]WJY77924.1 hypothetical protein CBOVI_07075 [Corynebacterium bovis DSM 20582 = CIP 54.80]